MEIITDYNLAANYLNKGMIGIVPSDTIYGISCLVSNQKNVERIYNIKKRDFSKPFIILISSSKDLLNFVISLTKEEVEITSKYWPGPVSIILSVTDPKLSYLHRNTFSLAFRLPNNPILLDLLQKTGPIVSTSANVSGNKPINSKEDVEFEFKDNIDFMLDVGELNNPPSKIIKILDGVEDIIRA